MHPVELRSTILSYAAPKKLIIKNTSVLKFVFCVLTRVGIFNILSTTGFRYNNQNAAVKSAFTAFTTNCKTRPHFLVYFYNFPVSNFIFPCKNGALRARIV
jgi:hypothetical protein